MISPIPADEALVIICFLVVWLLIVLLAMPNAEETHGINYRKGWTIFSLWAILVLLFWFPLFQLSALGAALWCMWKLFKVAKAKNRPF
ncbi:MAG: hypothetical protein ACU0BN_04690 [Sulfitobacter sp.]